MFAKDAEKVLLTPFWLIPFSFLLLFQIVIFPVTE